MSDYKVPSFEESFGSFGVNRMDLRVFDQDKFWVDKFGLPHLIANMSVNYLVNVLDFLEDNAAGFFHGCRAGDPD